MHLVHVDVLGAVWYDSVKIKEEATTWHHQHKYGQMSGIIATGTVSRSAQAKRTAQQSGRQQQQPGRVYRATFYKPAPSGWRENAKI